MIDKHSPSGVTAAGLGRAVLPRLFGPGERVFAVVMSCLLLRSGLSHLGNSYFFLSTVYSYDVVPAFVGEIIAATLPFFQITVAGCLLFRYWLIEAYLLNGLTFGGFVVAQLVVLSSSRKVTCGCFGADSSRIVGWQTLSLAVACSLISLYCGAELLRSGQAGGGSVGSEQ
jgi:hypothetical protein